jgi:hypothetical protein
MRLAFFLVSPRAAPTEAPEIVSSLVVGEATIREGCNAGLSGPGGFDLPGRRRIPSKSGRLLGGGNADVGLAIDGVILLACGPSPLSDAGCLSPLRVTIVA